MTRVGIELWSILCTMKGTRSNRWDPFSDNVNESTLHNLQPSVREDKEEFGILNEMKQQEVRMWLTGDMSGWYNHTHASLKATRQHTQHTGAIPSTRIQLRNRRAFSTVLFVILYWWETRLRVEVSADPAVHRNPLHIFCPASVAVVSQGFQIHEFASLLSYRSKTYFSNS